MYVRAQISIDVEYHLEVPEGASRETVIADEVKYLLSEYREIDTWPGEVSVEVSEVSLNEWTTISDYRIGDKVRLAGTEKVGIIRDIYAATNVHEMCVVPDWGKGMVGYYYPSTIHKLIRIPRHDTTK